MLRGNPYRGHVPAPVPRRPLEVPPARPHREFAAREVQDELMRLQRRLAEQRQTIDELRAAMRAFLVLIAVFFALLTCIFIDIV